LRALYRAGGRWRVGFDGAAWRGRPFVVTSIVDRRHQLSVFYSCNEKFLFRSSYWLCEEVARVRCGILRTAKMSGANAACIIIVYWFLCAFIPETYRCT
jgi:hypothetical protein